MVLGAGKTRTMFRILGALPIRRMSHLEPKCLWITLENQLFNALLTRHLTRGRFCILLMSHPFGTLCKNEIPSGINAREAPNLTSCELSQHLGESGGTTGKRPAMVLG